jgi:hypothetical protein
MTPENQSKIRGKILDAAASLKGRLPAHPAHPMGRNPYAHIPKVIKDACGGISYKDMPDESYELIVELIQYCVENPF